MKILIIDDDQGVAETLRITLEEKFPNGLDIIHHADFATAFEVVQKESPDVVVLDIYQGSLDEDRGTDVGQEIWDRHFCPFIIYTAQPQEKHEEIARRNPFIRLCIKRDRGDEEVAGYLQEFTEHIETVNSVQEDMLKTLRDSLKHVANIIWGASDNKEERLQLIKRVTRRRVAASLDFAANAKTKLLAWEQFIYPPIHGDDLLTGDILLQIDADSKAATSYRIVLTPSCDMVEREGKVHEALVAQCQPIKLFLKGAGLDKGSKLSSISTKLTLDQAGGYMALPALPGVLPLMAANLKLLELVELKQIQPTPIEVSSAAAQTPNPSELRFKRIASVDSPFRERVGWAYVQVSGRPGVPDIDNEKFAQEIQKEVNPVEGGS